MRGPNLYSFAYLSEYDKAVADLVDLARHERWEYKTDPSSYRYPILRNYINHTFKRLFHLHKKYPDSNYLYITDRNFCFDTGLFTKNFEPIFALFAANKQGYAAKWQLLGFYKQSAHHLKHIATLPSRAEYFSDIRELYYDTRYELRLNIDHILEDPENKKRIPEEYRESPSLPMAFRGMAIEYAKIRIKENYKAAVPQYFNGKIQFLVPISLGNPSTVDLALAVSRDGDIYSGRTCLTLDMAYNNARLIAKPETDWL